MNWEIIVAERCAYTIDSDVGIVLKVYPCDDEEVDGWTWCAFDPDGEELTKEKAPNYGPWTQIDIFAAVEAAEAWYQTYRTSDILDYEP